MEMFALAAKKKLRFTTSKGDISVEDLWDLPLTAEGSRPNLDDIAKKLYKELKSGEEISFVAPKAAESKLAQVQVKFDIVKYVIDVRLAEAEAAKKAKDTRAKNQRILELLAQKDDAELAAKSREELMEMLGKDCE